MEYTRKQRLPTDQAGYQKCITRPSTEQIYSIQLLAEKAITSSDYKIYIFLQDMSKAFDTVNRNQLAETHWRKHFLLITMITRLRHR